jgi:hypothetical protein
MICPKCAKKIDSSSYIFCGDCGAKVDEGATPATIVEKKTPKIVKWTLFLGGVLILFWLIVMAGNIGGAVGGGQSDHDRAAARAEERAELVRVFWFVLGAGGVCAAIGTLSLTGYNTSRTKKMRAGAHAAGIASSTQTKGYRYCRLCGADLPQDVGYCVMCGSLADKVHTN